MKKLIRYKVLDLIKIGIYTNQEIAYQLKISKNSVAVHMTYLRYLGHYIHRSEDGILRELSKETYNKITVLNPKKAETTILRKRLARLNKTLTRWNRIVDSANPAEYQPADWELFQTEMTAHIFLTERAIDKIQVLIDKNSNDGGENDNKQNDNK